MKPLFALALILIAQTPRGALAASEAELNSPWLSGEKKITPGALKPLLELAAEDPETEDLVQGIVKRLGATTPEELIQIVTLCKDVAPSVAGHFAPSEKTYLKSLRPDGKYSLNAEEKAVKKNAIEMEEKDTPTFHSLKVLTAPEICLRDDLVLSEAFAAFVHELTHFKGYQAFASDDVLNYDDERDYVSKQPFVPGGEFESYVAEGRAIRRLANRAKLKWEGQLLNYFDAEGKLADKEGLTQFIHERYDFKQDLSEAVVNEYNGIVQLANFEAKVLSNSQQNSQTAENNGDEDGKKFWDDYSVKLKSHHQGLLGKLKKIKERYGDLIKAE